MWFMLQETERTRVREISRVTADHVRQRLDAWIEFRLSALREVAHSVKESGRFDPITFRQHVRSLLRDRPGFQALNWIDAEGVIRVVVPESGNEQAMGADLTRHPDADVRKRLRIAQSADALQRTQLITLLQGGAGFATYLPVRGGDGSLLGLVNGVFRVTELVEQCLGEPRLREGFRFLLREADGEIAYTTPRVQDLQASPFLIRAEVTVVDKPWTLEIAPTAQEIARHATIADEVTLIAGLLATLLLAWLLRNQLLRRQLLGASEAHYRSLITDVLDASHAGLVIVIPTGAIVWLNRALEQIFNLDRAEVLGADLSRTLAQKIESGRLSVSEELMARLAQAAPEADVGALCSIHAGDIRRERWFEHRSAAIASGPFAGGQLHEFHDITRRRHAERDLYQAQKMQAVGNLAGGIAHDFNNLLQVILGRTDVLLLDAPEGSRTEAALREIVGSSELAAALTSQLLAFGGRQTLFPRVLDLNRLVRDHLKMLSRMIGEDIHLVTELDDQTPPVRCDAAQLDQVLMNLCLNAREAMPDGGRLVIRTRRALEPRDLAGDGEPVHPVVIEVIDEGVGIATEDLDHVVEPFFSTKSDSRGRGLGLSTVDGIVHQHGGRLEIESRQGAGTTVRVLLPPTAGDVDPTPEAPEREAPRTRGAATILLAEDNESVRALMASVLEEAGHQVLACADGAEALSVFQAHADEIDLVVSDVVMPNIGGVALYGRIRETGTTVPFIFMTGYGDDAKSDDIDAEVLLKPFRPETLLAHVSATLRATVNSAD